MKIQNKILFSCALLLASLSSASSTDDENFRPYFESLYQAYPAEAATTGPKGKLQWENDKKAKLYKTRLNQEWDAAKEPNFDGHYFAVNTIGCGTGCAVIFVVDWETGKIFYPPKKMDASYEFRKDSRLIILNPYESCSAYGSSIFYELNHERFLSVKNDHPCPNQHT